MRLYKNSIFVVPAKETVQQTLTYQPTIESFEWCTGKTRGLDAFSIAPKGTLLLWANRSCVACVLKLDSVIR